MNSSTTQQQQPTTPIKRRKLNTNSNLDAKDIFYLDYLQCLEDKEVEHILLQHIYDTLTPPPIIRQKPFFSRID